MHIAFFQLSRRNNIWFGYYSAIDMLAFLLSQFLKKQVGVYRAGYLIILVRQLRVVAWMHITFCPSLSKVIKCTPSTKRRDWHPIYSESNYWWGGFSIDGIWNFNSKSPTLKIISSWRLELFYCSSVVHRADLFHSSSVSGTIIWPEFSSDLYNNKSWQKWVHLCVIHLSLNRHHRQSS